MLEYLVVFLVALSFFLCVLFFMFLLLLLFCFSFINRFILYCRHCSGGAAIFGVRSLDADIVSLWSSLEGMGQDMVVAQVCLLLSLLVSVLVVLLLLFSCLSLSIFCLLFCLLFPCFRSCCYRPCSCTFIVFVLVLVHVLALRPLSCCFM